MRTHLRAAVLLAAALLLMLTGVTPASAAETTRTGFITGYSWYDNDPPGSAAVAYEDVVPGRTGAGGTGTYADPVTAAVPQSAGLAPGTRLYVPHLSRYFIVEDLCATSHSAPDGCTAAVDVWVDGRDVGEAASDKCMSDLTRTAQYIVDPAQGKPVASGPICGGSGTPTPEPTDPPAPADPVTLTAQPGDRSATVTYSVDAAALGVNPSTTGVWLWRDGTSSSTGKWYRSLSGTHTYTGLTNGTTYTLRLTVVRDGGAEVARDAVTVTAGTAPAPTPAPDPCG